MSTADIKKNIAPIFKEYGIKRAELFGSFSRGDETSKSDVDILVSLGKPMGMFTYMHMIRDIEKNLAKKLIS